MPVKLSLDRHNPQPLLSEDRYITESRLGNSRQRSSTAFFAMAFISSSSGTRCSSRLSSSWQSFSAAESAPFLLHASQTCSRHVFSILPRQKSSFQLTTAPSPWTRTERRRTCEGKSRLLPFSAPSFTLAFLSPSMLPSVSTYVLSFVSSAIFRTESKSSPSSPVSQLTQRSSVNWRTL